MSRVMELVRELLAELELENENECTCDREENKGTLLSELNPGDLFNVPEIGKLKVLEQLPGGLTAVVQNDFYEEDVVFDENTCDYIKSALRKKFDGEITELYEKVFGEALVEREVALKSVDMQDYGTFKCKVRPILFDEARDYNALLVNEDLPDLYWTCTPWSTEERGWKYSVTVVAPSGRIFDDNCDCYFGVRPFCILKSNIFVSKE